MAFNPCMTVVGMVYMHGMFVHASVDDLVLDAMSQWVGSGKTISVELSRQLIN